MNKQIKKVTLVFENCEYMNFDVDEINYISMEKVSNEYIKSWYENTLREYRICRNFEILLTSDANNDYIPAWSDRVEGKKFDRILQCDDICTIEFKYFDDSRESFDLIWNKSSNQNNNYQKSKLVEDGLLIKVKWRKDKK